AVQAHGIQYQLRDGWIARAVAHSDTGAGRPDPKAQGGAGYAADALGQARLSPAACMVLGQSSYRGNRSGWAAAGEPRPVPATWQGVHAPAPGGFDHVARDLDSFDLAGTVHRDIETDRDGIGGVSGSRDHDRHDRP